MRAWAGSVALHALAAVALLAVWQTGQDPRPEVATRVPLQFVSSPPAPAPSPARVEPKADVQPSPPALSALPPPMREAPADPQEVAPAPQRPVSEPAMPTPAQPPAQVVQPPLAQLPVAEAGTVQPALMPAPERLVPSPHGPASTPARAMEAPPRPPAPVQEDSRHQERLWYQALLDELRLQKRYPLAARRLGQEGVVVVSVRVRPDGGIEAAGIAKGSGFAMLDRAALTLIERAVATVGEQMSPRRSTTLEIPVAYRLDG